MLAQLSCLHIAPCAIELKCGRAATSKERGIGTVKSSRQFSVLAKAPTGIEGLDEITGGGIPRGRPTLVCGTAGCGKSLMGIEFLVHGAVDFNEPGVLMTFEETAEDIKKNVASLGFDLDELIRRKKLHI